MTPSIVLKRSPALLDGKLREARSPCSCPLEPNSLGSWLNARCCCAEPCTHRGLCQLLDFVISGQESWMGLLPLSLASCFRLLNSYCVLMGFLYSCQGLPGSKAVPSALPSSYA